MALDLEAHANPFVAVSDLVREPQDSAQILHHESGHAILWALEDPRWDCFEHDDLAFPNYEPACRFGVRR